METIKKDTGDYCNDLPEIHEALMRGVENKHILFILDVFKNEGLSLKKLFEYGVSHLPNDDGRPDIFLSNYFFVLSEIKELPEAVRSFAMDAMIYCENDPSFPASSITELRDQYKKITPLFD